MDKKLKRTDSQSSLCDSTPTLEELPKTTTKINTDTMATSKDLHDCSLDGVPTVCIDITDTMKQVVCHNGEQHKEKDIVTKTKKKLKKNSKKKRKKCNMKGCRKRLKLFPTVCCCGHSYCGYHHDKPSHKCKGDNHDLYKDKLQETFPQIRPIKINDI